jgi:hypothetical protein
MWEADNWKFYARISGDMNTKDDDNCNENNFFQQIEIYYSVSGCDILSWNVYHYRGNLIVVFFNYCEYLRNCSLTKNLCFSTSRCLWNFVVLCSLLFCRKMQLRNIKLSVMSELFLFHVFQDFIPSFDRETGCFMWGYSLFWHHKFSAVNTVVKFKTWKYVLC